MTPQERMAASLDQQVDAADKLLKSSDDEMTKPDKQRDLKKALSLKISAAQAYLRVSAAAKIDATQIKKDDQPAFLDKYDKPNREKAISLFLDVAAAAQDAKDYQDAIALYKQVLILDPTNATAQAGLKTVDQEMKTAVTNTGATGGGGNNQIQPWETWKKDYTGTTNWRTWY